MRGPRERSGSLFSYVSIEERIPDSHPLRRIRRLADQALDRLNSTFCEPYAAEARPSVPPEQLLLAYLIVAVHLSGPTVSRIHQRRHQARAKVLALQSPVESVRKAMPGASNSPTRPNAQRLITTRAAVP